MQIFYHDFIQLRMSNLQEEEGRRGRTKRKDEEEGRREKRVCNQTTVFFKNDKNAHNTTTRKIFIISRSYVVLHFWERCTRYSLFKNFYTHTTNKT